ncbi:PIN domain-containing protein [Methylocaldum szegediense]|jgi:predicted nucleic acid-binding protein|uniref:PIN domain-containing protein n=1 Tax=Methylocaldum szegediense TaxID=73780 RepID=UPI00047A5AE0|nr:PIN domain-containing protein [Methylocaldum szegediense]
MRGTKASFFDTNVLLYLLSGDEVKADRAEAVVSQGGVISIQVLNEFVSIGVRKLGMSYAEIRDVLTPIRLICRIEPLSLETHDLGLQVAERYGFSMYDALTVASALLAGCDVLYTEDLQNGQLIEERLEVRNPFAAS